MCKRFNALYMLILLFSLIILKIFLELHESSCSLHEVWCLRFSSTILIIIFCLLQSDDISSWDHCSFVVTFSFVMFVHNAFSDVKHAFSDVYNCLLSSWTNVFSCWTFFAMIAFWLFSQLSLKSFQWCWISFRVIFFHE